MKDLNYWKNNCEEDYINTPISVLRYITELEKVNCCTELPTSKQLLSDCKKHEAHELIKSELVDKVKSQPRDGSEDSLHEGISSFAFARDEGYDRAINDVLALLHKTYSVKIDF